MIKGLPIVRFGIEIVIMCYESSKDATMALWKLKLEVFESLHSSVWGFRADQIKMPMYRVAIFS